MTLTGGRRIVSGATQVPVVDQLFTWSDESANLIGSRCFSCNTYFFPKSVTCRNPNCKEKKVEEVLLSRRGKLYSYTIQEYQPPPPFRMEPLVPFAVGMVELPEGIRVLGILTGCELNDIKVGMDVEMVIEELYQNEQGADVVTYKFKPVA